MPLKYWSFAFQTAIFLINRLPSAVLSQNSSYGVLYNRLPDYTSLQSFGCLCFPYLRPYASHKLANRSVVCYFLGYRVKHKGFLCLNMASSQIYASHHVVFDETQFPFLTKSLSSQPVSSSNSSSTFLDYGILSIPPPSSRNPNHPQPIFSSPITIPTDFVPSHPSSSPTLPQSSTPASTIDHLSLPNRTIVTRSQNGIFKPKKIFSLVVQTIVVEPSSFKEAMLHHDWQAAMKIEYVVFLTNSTWKLVPKPVNKRIIGCKWIYKLKLKADGLVDRFKARLVAKGFNQTYGIDYFETFCLVVKPTTIRIIFSLAISHGWLVKQLDVNNVFLNGELEEEVYMVQHLGFVDHSKPDFVCKLSQSLVWSEASSSGMVHQIEELFTCLGLLLFFI